MGLIDSFLGLSPSVQGAIISGIGGATSGILGALESRRTRESNEEIAASNAALARQDRQQLLDLLTAPVTDARGNVTSFDPVGGFSTTLSPMSQDILNASDREEFARTTEDANIRRRGLRANEQARAGDRRTGEFFRDRLLQPSTVDTDSIRDLLLSRASTSVNLRS